MGKIELSTVPCPVCKSPITGVTVEEDSILEATRVPVLIPAKCSGGNHPVVLFVDKQFAIRDIEGVGGADQDNGDENAVAKAHGWLDSL